MKDPRGYIKWKDILRILAIAKERSIRDYTLLVVLAKTGRRVSEILMLEPRDIDIEEQNINWNILKRDKGRREVIPTDPETLKILLKYIDILDIGQDNRVFSISRQRVFQLVRWYGEKADILHIGSSRIHPHHFRHSFAVMFANKSKTPADIRKLQLFMGHANLSTTEHYLKFSKADMKEIINDMPNVED